MTQFKKGMLLGALALACSAGSALAGDVRIFTFEGYTDDAWVKPFETETGCAVHVTYTGSTDEMFAKMIGSNGDDYDLIAIDTSLFPQYIDRGLIQPYDTSLVPNLANLLPAFQNVEEVSMQGQLYGIPVAWGSLGLIYDKEAFATPPDSWEVLWNPETAKRAIILDDANNNVVNAAIMLGIDDPFNLGDAQFEAVKAKLIEQKRNILSFYAGFDEGVNVWETGGANLMFSMGESQLGSLLERGYDAAYIIPSEGGIGWLDTFALSAGARDTDCAHAWVNYFLAGDVGPAMSAAHGYGNTTAASEGLDYADRLLWLKPVESMEKRVKVWSEVKAAQ